MPVGWSPCLDRQVLWNLPCMRQLSELAHEYAAMGVLSPIQLIGRRCDEYPLVQDTVSSPLNWSSSWGRSSILPNYSSSSVVGPEIGSTNPLIFDLEDRQSAFEEFTRRVSEEPL